MSPGVATLAYSVLILGLFALDRDRKSRTSPALWLPALWLSVAGSRAFSQWMAVFGFGGMATASEADQLVDGSPMDRNFLMALLVIGLIILFKRKREAGRLLRANAPILAFFLYCGVSFIWSDYPAVTLKRWFKALGDLVMVLIVLTDVTPPAAIRRLLSRVGFVLLPLSILFIKYYGDLGRDYRPDYGFWKLTYTGVTTSKNVLGMITLIFGLGSAWRVLQAFGRKDKERTTGSLIAHCVLLAIVAWLLWITNSMTSLSCFLMAVGLMVATKLRFMARRPALVHVLVTTMLVSSASVLFLDLGSGVLESMGRDPTLTGRTAIWDLVLSMTGNPFLGTGFDSFWLGQRLEKMWSIYWWHPNEAHNGYLELYLTLGWIGVLLFTAVVASGYRNIMNGLRTDPDSGRLKLAYFVIALSYNFTESAIRMMNPVWIIFLLVSTAVPEPSATAVSPPSRRVTADWSDRVQQNRQREVIETVRR